MIEPEDEIRTLQQQLRELQAELIRLQQMLNRVSDAIFALDADWRFTYLNPQAEVLLRYPAVELLGRSVWEAFPEAVDTAFYQQYHLAMDDQQSVTFEAQYEPFNTLFAVRAYPSHEGLTVIFQDISERERVAKALRESEAKYRLLFESIDEGFCIIKVIFNEDGTPIDYCFLEINPAFENQTGLYDAVGKRIRKMIPEYEEYWFEIYGSIVLTGEPRRFENQAAALHRWYDVYAFRVGEPEERKVAVLFNDITERKQAEEALRDSEARYHAFSEASSEGIAIHEHGIILEVNRNIAEHLGYTPEEMRGRSVLEYLAPESWEEVARRIRTEDPGPYLAVSLHKDGSKIIGEMRARNFIYHSRPVRLVAMRDVTEQTHLEQERERLLAQVEAERARWQGVVEGIADEVWVADNEGRMSLINLPAVTQMGLHEFEGKSVYQVLEEVEICYTDGRVRPPEEAPLLRSLHGEIVRGEEIMRSRKTGNMRYRQFISAPTRNAEGRITGAVAIVRDVTEHKELEQERERLLIEVERRADELDAIFNAIVDPTAAFDAEGRLIRANPAMALTIGRDPCGMTHAEIARFLSMRRPDGTLLEETETPIIRALRGEPVVGERLLITDVDQHVMIVMVSATPLIEQERPWGVVSIWHDISKREHALEQVQRRSAELDATINSVADGLIIYSSEGEILLDNPAARRMLDGILIDKEFSSIIPQWLSRSARKPDGVPLAFDEEPGARAASGETVIGEVIVFQHKDGTEAWTSVAAAPIRLPDDSIIGVVSTYTDITRLHELQEEREVYIHTISHDLRAPLAVIQGHADLTREILQQKGLDDLLISSNDAIRQGVKRMNVMIQDLVDAARLEGGQLALTCQPVSLHAFLDDLLHRAATAMAVERIQVEMPDTLPSVTADPGRLERIFTNLFSNALKYSDPGTPVIVRAKPMDGQIEVSVQDVGQGIDLDDLPHIFERFYRAKGQRKTEGVGLGLYITRMLVEAHGGRIWVESEPAKGSIFRFTLPVATS